MKALAKVLLGRRGIDALRQLKARRALIREYRQDRLRYASSSMPEDHLVDERLRGRNLEGQLTKDYHRVEKGLALATPRRPFGADVERRLAMLLPSAQLQFPGASFVDHAETALEALRDWNDGGSRHVDAVSPYREQSGRGVEVPSRFFLSRHSVRDFADRQVDAALLEEAVELASASPSVCNRQAWFVRIYLGEQVTEILKHQNGSSGFRDGVPAVALVAVDSALFAGPGERNQGWIEGGIFCMSLVWALHALGLDSCMLNMSLTNAQSAQLRIDADLADSELIIMMIAIGYGAEGHRRARSPRRGARSLMRIYGDVDS